ncbi:hypothetical protein [Serratia oryzae]|uniref:Uncharacterized protein n=1 Tax=Serratia oryzae TaxID=2034155 RepID=A0A1S8CNG0_9GAMM|nr:hypothetical protein [Serratia oryzae]OMQ24788.1 hypothetical protein BMI79_08190 [Serratia oryzae]
MTYDLEPNWKPGGGVIVTWYGIDKNGRVAIFLNNRWGNLPSCLLSMKGAEDSLDSISEYLYEESGKYKPICEDKKGDYKLDMFPSWIGPKDINSLKAHHDRIFLENRLSSDANLVANKGLFIYQAVEGNEPKEDYPVGYEGDTEMGDYYRYMVPTIYGGIEDFPQELRKGIAVSDSLDFTVDRLIPNKNINEHFKKMFG